MPYDQFVARLLNPDAAGRSRRIPHRRQLARRDERRGHALDAGVAEHGAGVPRRQLQVQRLPRQLRQQVEAEGRVRPGGVLLARAEAAALSLRHRARRIRRAVVLLSGAGAPGRRRRRWPTAARRLAAIFTDPRNGRMPRTVVNRIWTRLLGHGIVANSDEMDGKPWSPELLDWLASDFVAHKYDLKHLIATIMHVARLPDAGGGAHGRGAGARLRRSAARSSAASPPSSSPMRSARSPASGASTRRHRRASRQPAATSGRRGAQRAGGQPAGSDAADVRMPSRRAGITTCVDVTATARLDAPDPRARPADSRSGDVGPRAARRRRCRRWSW